MKLEREKLRVCKWASAALSTALCCA